MLSASMASLPRAAHADPKPLGVVLATDPKYLNATVLTPPVSFGHSTRAPA